jgi:hypothetical protein
MGKSINPMFILKIQGEAGSGSALRSFIVLMSLRPAIPWQVALLHCLPPLHWPVSIFEPSVTICQPSLKEVLERSWKISAGLEGTAKAEYQHQVGPI